MRCLNRLAFSLCCLMLSLAASTNSFSQRAEIDSLKRVLSGTLTDSARVETLNILSKKYFNESPDTALLYAKQSRELAEKAGYRAGMGEAVKNEGTVYYIRGDNIEAVNSWNKANEIFGAIGLDSMVAVVTGNIGAVYFNQGDETKAIEYYLKALKMGEDRHDTMRIVVNCSNIGAVYQNKSATLDKSFYYYLRAWNLSPSLPRNPELADYIQELRGTIAVNVGEIYLCSDENINPADCKNRNLDSARYYFDLAIGILKGTRHVPYALNDLGKVYREQGAFDNAIRSQEEAFEIARSFDAKDDMAIARLGLAQTYKSRGDWNNSLKMYMEAEGYAKETDASYQLKKIYNGLTEIYAQKGDYANAFRYQTKYLYVKDAIYNLETDKKLGTLQFTFDLQKKESEISLLTKDKQLQEQELRRQRMVRNGFVGGFAVMVLFASVFFAQRNRISKEKKRSDELLLNILPEETAEELKATGKAKAKSFDLVSVLFTDFKNFTQASEKLSPEELVEEINHCYSEFDKIITRHGLEKIKTIGDAYMCAGGLPVTNTTHPFDIVSAGLEMVAFIEQNKQERIRQEQPYFELRLGIHTGPVVAGIVGIKKFAYDIWGDTVNTASRMESSGEVGRVNISGTTYELVRERFLCTHRGKVKAKNKGEIDMYFVDGPVA
jgi:adenylate cyclase